MEEATGPRPAEPDENTAADRLGRLEGEYYENVHYLNPVTGRAGPSPETPNADQISSVTLGRLGETERMRRSLDAAADAFRLVHLYEGIELRSRPAEAAHLRRSARYMLRTAHVLGVEAEQVFWAYGVYQRLRASRSRHVLGLEDARSLIGLRVRYEVALERLIHAAIGVWRLRSARLRGLTRGILDLLETTDGLLASSQTREGLAQARRAYDEAVSSIEWGVAAVAGYVPRVPPTGNRGDQFRVMGTHSDEKPLPFGAGVGPRHRSGVAEAVVLPFSGLPVGRLFRLPERSGTAPRAAGPPGQPKGEASEEHMYAEADRGTFARAVASFSGKFPGRIVEAARRASDGAEAAVSEFLETVSVRGAEGRVPSRLRSMVDDFVASVGPTEPGRGASSGEAENILDTAWRPGVLGIICSAGVLHDFAGALPSQVTEWPFQAAAPSMSAARLFETARQEYGREILRVLETGILRARQNIAGLCELLNARVRRLRPPRFPARAYPPGVERGAQAREATERLRRALLEHLGLVEGALESTYLERAENAAAEIEIALGLRDAAGADGTADNMDEAADTDVSS